MQTLTKQIDFTNEKLFVAIDTHKKSWTVTIRMLNLHLRTFSMNPSPERLYRHLVKNYPGAAYHCVYEAGGCGFSIHRKLNRLGIKTRVVNPADVPTNDKEKKNKKDPVDSRKLCRELEKQSLEPIYIPDEFSEQLRCFCRLRSKIRQKTTRIKNQIKGYLHFSGMPLPEHHEMAHWSGAFIKWLESLEFAYEPGKETLLRYLRELQFYRNEMAEIIKTLRRFSHQFGFSEIIRYLLSVPGIGFVTAITLYTELMDISRFETFNQLACYLGFAPDIYGSGERERNRGLTNRCNKYLRYLLIEAAWVAIRQDPVLTFKFKELTKRMTKQDAIVRIAKKLVSRIRYVWKNQKVYVPAVVQ